MSKSVSKSIRLTTSMLAIALAMCASRPALAEGKTYHFNIPAEGTAKALLDFSRQADVQIVFPAQVLEGRSSAAISGQYDRATVLKLLLEGTGLEVASESDVLITLRAAASEKVGSVGHAEDSTEVVVTGTHIRGGNPTSPVRTITRTDIDRSGYSQVGDLLRSMPENFSGGQNPGVIGATAQDNNNHNSSGASTVNLRGLGTDATLVLVNGHRLSSDTSFQSSDISAVPMAAIDHIDIVPDGASALYGSDAVGGVVNFVLRRNFSGGAISARIGGASDGGGLERTYSGLVGQSGPSGYLLGNVEYSRQNEIRASQRDFTAGVTPVTSLLPEQARKTLFISAGRHVTDRDFISLDGLVGDRLEILNSQTTKTSVWQHYTVKNPSYSAALGYEHAFNGGWKFNLSAVSSGSRNSSTYVYPATGATGNATYWNSLSTLEAVADGTLLELPSGPVKLAFGVGSRHENFQEGRPGQSFFVKADRQANYIFSEALIPLVAASTDRPGLEALELSLSTRSESYSDVGASTTPKIGIRYVPVKGLTVRASLGKSFKAPTFLQLYQARNLYLFNASSLGSAGGGTALLSTGGNRDLKPERSQSWTAGADYMPAEVPGLKLSATWFDIDYRNRVVTPFVVLSTAMSDPRYASFVTLAPSATDQSALIAQASQFSNYSSGSYNPAAVVASVTDTFVNATAQEAHGLDLGYRQIFGPVTVFANATWETLKQRTIPTLAPLELSGTIGRVPQWKGRGGATWSAGRLTATAIVNFVSAETDIGVTPNAKIGSWTTTDLNVGYALSNTAGPLEGIRLVLAASNLFDRAPPYAGSPSATYPGIRYDSTNTGAVGRFVSFTITKAW